MKLITDKIQQYFPLVATALTLALLVSGALAQSPALPNMGQDLTPLKPLGSAFLTLNTGLTSTPNWMAGQAVTTIVSPSDLNTLLVLTSGFNRVYKSQQVAPGLPPWSIPDSNEYVFIYDISSGTPLMKQPPLQIPNSYSGMVFDPSGKTFYVAGGSSDNVHIFTLSSSTGTWIEAPNSPLALGHNAGLGVSVQPCVAGVSISSDGFTLVAANYYNDSITVFKRTVDYPAWVKVSEVDLRPGKADPSKTGVPGGEYPFWVVVKGKGSSATAYVSSIRDREIDVVSLGSAPAVMSRIAVKGQPNKMTLNASQSLLYVADDQSDTVDVIDTAKNVVVETIPVVAPLLPSSVAQYKGANPNSVTLSADERQLFVTDGNLNCISVVALSGNNTGDKVVGLIPTGWYPNSLSFGADGKAMYVINSKSPTGPNKEWCYGGYGPVGSPNCAPANKYAPQMTKAGLQSFPLPDMDQLATLTAQVIANNRLASTESAGDAQVMKTVRQSVKHVIFVLKENRTYDQILGDLKTHDGKALGDGDASMAVFGESITPNQHNLARNFVTLDHFMDTAEVSYDGWLWSTAAQAPDVVQRQFPVVYSYRGLSGDVQGIDRNVNVAIPTVAGRQKANPFTPGDPDLLPGQVDVAAPDGPNGEINTGFLWDAALRAGLSVRSYGFFVDLTRYSTPQDTIPISRNPFETGTIQAYASSVSLAPYTDLYFRGFDTAYPDFYRYAEWAREFDYDYGGSGLPALSLVRLGQDHTGSWVAGKTGFPPAIIDGVNTPELQVADNDYAVGLLVQKVAGSKYANNTLIFVVEDDAQDGGDHIDAHRSTAFVVGPFVKQGALVKTPYNTLNFLRTMEEVLGLPPMNLNDAIAAPMADIFDTSQATPKPWNFTAAPSAYLYNTQLALPPKPVGLMVPKTTHNQKYWARVTKGMDFTDADRVDSVAFNRILWKGLMGKKPYPAGLADEKGTRTAPDRE